MSCWCLLPWRLKLDCALGVEAELLGLAGLVQLGFLIVLKCSRSLDAGVIAGPTAHPFKAGNLLLAPGLCHGVGGSQKYVGFCIDLDPHIRTP